MADNEIRNPAKAYFKWKMPVITKSEDDWNFWNTEDKYNRTMFIGYNDTTTPHVASLFMIVDGKPMQAVGNDVIARIAGLETNTAQALADIQALIDRVNAQQLDIDALKQECYRILNNAKDAVTDAQTWAEGTDEEVADLGGEHSAKGWAQKANEIVSSGLPSDVTFDHLTVTGSSKFGQDPDRENQPGLEIESTGEIQAHRTVNMMNGATVSYDETVEMPWSDSSNKVPNTAWVQQAVQHGTIDPNTELSVKKVSTTGGGAWLYGERIDDSGGKSLAYLNVHKPTSETDGAYITLHVNSEDLGYGANFEVREGTVTMSSRWFVYFDNGDKTADTEALRIGQAASQAYATKRYIYSELVGRLANGLQIGLVNGNEQDGTPFKVVRSDTSTVGKWTAAFGVTPTVPDITDDTDATSKVPNTKWVQGCVTAKTLGFQPKLTAGEGIEISADNVISATGGGTGGGAVTSVNGKTGEVVLAAADVGAVTTADITTALEPYAKTADVTTTLADYAKSADVTTEITTATAGLQPKLTAGANITISEDNVISATGGTGGAVDSVNGKTGAVVLTAADVGAITGAEADTKITTALEPYAKTADVTTVLEPYAKSADVTAEITAAVAPLATTEALTAGLAGKQGTLTAGSGIAISDTNVISATVSSTVDSVNGKVGAVVLNGQDIKVDDTEGASTVKDAIATKQGTLTAGTGIAISTDNVISATVSSAVDSVNGKTGAVVLTGEDVNVDTTAGASTIKAAIAAKQDAITAGTDLDVRSVKAHYTATTTEGETQQYTMAVTGNGFELTDVVNSISWAQLTPTELNVPSLVTNGAPGVDTLLTCNGPAKIAALSSIGNQWATGAFNWDINTTTDYNKFEVYNTYYTTDAETGSTVPNRSVALSIGGSPDNHSTWIDFTANYLSFKGNTNFGETGMSHTMNFNGPSTFNNEATFTQNVTLGHGESTTTGEGGTSTTTPASLVLVEGDMVASGNATFNKGLSASGTVHLNDVTFWREISGGVISSASYSYSTGAFDIGYLTSNDSGTSANRVTIVSDSREANYGAVFNLPVTMSDASFKRTSTLAADDNSTEVPTTAWVKAAITAGGSSIPDDITCKTLKVTNWDSELDSIEFAGNLKYSGDYGNGSLGIITAREFFANSSGYYGTRVRTSGITLTYGSGSVTWFNADSDARTLTISGTLKSSTPASDANNTEVATTAWVNTAITNKSATKPTLTYVTKSGTRFITTKVEQCTGGKLCTIYWRSSTVNNAGTYYIDVPTEFAGATIASTVFTSNDHLTPAVWVATSALTAGKIKLDVASTNTTSSTSASAIIVLAVMD